MPEPETRVSRPLVITQKAEFFKALNQAANQSHFENSRFARADYSKASGELKQTVADTVLRSLQGVPGFSPPRLSSPPTQAQLKGLLQQLVQAEKQGLLKGGNYDAARPETARKDNSPVAKDWGAFVQETNDAQKAQGRALEGSQQELFSEGLQNSASLFEGAGLRSPILTGDPFAALTNKQKLTLMTDAFGPLGQQLKDAGIRDPLSLLNAAVTPQDRAALADKLGISRGELLVHLARAELLLIGPGKGGAQALRPQHLPALAQSGIVTLAQLSAVRSLDPSQLDQLYASVRSNYTGFARAMSGERPILKKDLAHWAKGAAKKKSSILDSDWDEQRGHHGDAQEQIMAWYLEHFSALEDKHKKDHKGTAALQLDMPHMKLDQARNDGLVCYWIERPNFDGSRPTFSEMAYVCLDPKTGIVDQKQLE